MLGSVERITPEDAEKCLQQDRSLIVLDVRINTEVKGGKIPGARNIPLQELPNRINEMAKDKEYICVCRSGNRSGKAAKFLKKKGYKVKNMSGGMMNWKGKVKRI
ncbi:MAG TPA: rhodanese-like domain-containing protein [Bacillales bacterium]